MKTRFVLICLGVATLVFGFQNCSEVGFSNASDKGTLVAKDVGGTTVDTGDGTTTTPDTTTTDTTDTDTDTDDTTEVPDTAHEYVCVLNGNGKSQKIGFINGKLLSKNATPDDVCMSAEACTDIISTKFDVYGPEKRGFCPGKAHTIELTNTQIKAYVDAL